MTEAYEDDWLVRVRAQVMCRDEGTGGWLPLGGGGLSNVMVRKRSPRHSSGPLDTLLSGAPESRPGRSPPPRPAHAHHTLFKLEAGALRCEERLPAPAPQLKFEYFILGKRISDQSVVLSCTIKKDFQYNKVMPTFHHWVTDEKRFGLTFQTAADARAFDKGVRTAIEDLLDGLGGAWPSLHAYKKHNPAPKDDEDDNIFECLNLPSDSRSSSENSTVDTGAHRSAARPDGLPASHVSVPGLPLTAGLSSSARELMLKKKLAGSCSEEPPLPDPLGADYSYVQLTQVHEYILPGLGGERSPSAHSTAPGSTTTTHSLLQRRDSGSSLKKRGTLGMYVEGPGMRPPPLPAKKRDRDLAKKPTDNFHARLKCRHCQEWYMESSNKPGSCEYAPDCFRTCINGATGIQCAQCMLYHCMADAEGDFPSHPCSCNTGEDGCGRRWLGLALLSLLVPCLWCYPPLRAVHWCCVGCGVAGGRHTPAPHSLHVLH